MSEFDKNNLPPEFKPELLHHYLELTDEESAHVLETEELESPLFSEMKSRDQNYVDKQMHSIGGMKIICKVNDLRTGRPVAMAEMKKRGECSHDEVEQFLREARITATLEHPNIVPIYDIGLNRHGKPFFTMKFMKDQSLKKIIRELVKANPVYTSKYSLNILLDIFLKVCEAVAFAHSSRIVHLDIKPANIMIGDYGEVYVCDWGLAKLLDSSREEYVGIAPLDETIMNEITLSGVVKGTPGFMAPEQVDSKFGVKNEQTDVYALGALLYAMLALKRPYAGMDVDATLKATMKGSPTPPSDIALREVHKSLDAICMKAMEISQEKRYNSVEELISDIRSYQEGFATEAEGATVLETLGLLLKRNKVLSVMLLVVVTTGVSVGGVLSNMLKRRETKVIQELRHKELEIGRLKKVAEEKSERLKKVHRLYADGLIAKWTMDELSGFTSVDDELGVLNGAVVGVASCKVGHKGNALEFDGVDNYVVVGDVGKQAYSITMWVKLESEVNAESKPMNLLQYGPHSLENVVSFGAVSSYMNGETLTIIATSPANSRTYIKDVFTKGWHHLAFVWDVSKKRYNIFVDGTSRTVYAAPAGDAALMELTHLKLGGTSEMPEHRFKGSIDEVCIYGRVLSGREVEQMATQ